MWQKKSSYEKLVEDFYKYDKQRTQDDFVHLETDRIFASAWVDVCKNLQNFPAQQVSEFEKLITEGVEQKWGPCDFKFDREKGQIVVKARDGRCMELVSGEVYSEEAV